MRARRAPIPLAAQRRIGWAGRVRNAGICHEPKGSFRFLDERLDLVQISRCFFLKANYISRGNVQNGRRTMRYLVTGGAEMADAEFYRLERDCGINWLRQRWNQNSIFDCVSLCKSSSTRRKILSNSSTPPLRIWNAWRK